MSPTGPTARGRVRPVAAAVRLLGGLALCGSAVALLVRSGAGLGPWDVLHEGLAVRTGAPIGRMVIVVGAVLLLAWIPLRQRPGVGTLTNVVLIGLTVDGVLAVLPAPTAGGAAALGYAVAAVPMMGVGTGLYLGVDLGAGPRDGIMTGLADRGVPVWLARTGIESTALGLGWLLGGTVGIGTVWFALGIGPAVAWSLPRFRAGWHRDAIATAGAPAPS